jgi:hypothetical protein
MVAQARRQRHPHCALVHPSRSSWRRRGLHRAQAHGTSFFRPPSCSCFDQRLWHFLLSAVLHVAFACATDIVIHGPTRGSSAPAHQHWRLKKEKGPEAPKEREGNRGTHALSAVLKKEKDSSTSHGFPRFRRPNKEEAPSQPSKKDKTWLEFKLEVQTTVCGPDDPGHALG